MKREGERKRREKGGRSKEGGTRDERGKGNEGTCMLSPVTKSSSGWLELLHNVFPLAAEPGLP